MKSFDGKLYFPLYTTDYVTGTISFLDSLESNSFVTFTELPFTSNQLISDARTALTASYSPSAFTYVDVTVNI